MSKFDIAMMKTAKVWAEQSYCKRAKVGAVLSKDSRIISVGYNGTPSHFENNCEDVEYECLSNCCNDKIYDVDGVIYCLNCDKSIGFIDLSGDINRWIGDFTCKPKLKTDHSKVIHAEANAILFAAKNGIATNGCDLYVTLSPCFECVKMIIQAGIKRVIYLEEYRDTKSLELLRKAGVKVEQIKI